MYGTTNRRETGKPAEKSVAGSRKIFRLPHLPQPANGIAIGSFAGRDAGDVELLRVGALLDELAAEEDVRAALQARFDLEHELGEWRAMVEGGGHTG